MRIRLRRTYPFALMLALLGGGLPLLKVIVARSTNPRAAVARNPADDSASAEAARRNSIGVAYMGQQRFAEAQKQFEEALKAQPGYALARLNLGIALLRRSARGAKPTAAGQKFYEEASSILRRYENLPSLVRSSTGAIEGPVSLGMPASLSTTLVGPFIERTRAAHRKITLKFIDGDSEFLREECRRMRG